MKLIRITTENSSDASPPPSAAARLRSATRQLHEQVDTAFSAFDLGDQHDYGRFLSAHARATFTAEAGIGDWDDLSPWRPRRMMLERDLADLGLDPPSSVAPQLPDGDAARWGVLYVLEGSRLGGSVLLKRTLPSFPRSFLSASHVGKEWRTLLSEIDGRGNAGGEAWFADAEAGACYCFNLYLQAAWF